MATAINTQGIVVKYQDGDLVLRIVGGVVSVTYGGGTAASIDITSLADTQKTFRQGLADRGNVTLELVTNLNDAGQIELLTAMEAQDTGIMSITYASGTLDSDIFNAFVVSIENNGTVDGKVMSTVVLKISGSIFRTDSKV